VALTGAKSPSVRPFVAYGKRRSNASAPAATGPARTPAQTTLLTQPPAPTAPPQTGRPSRRPGSARAPPHLPPGPYPFRQPSDHPMSRRSLVPTGCRRADHGALRPKPPSRCSATRPGAQDLSQADTHFQGKVQRVESAHRRSAPAEPRKRLAPARADAGRAGPAPLPSPKPAGVADQPQARERGAPYPGY
jgi:hypothetical protein